MVINFLYPSFDGTEVEPRTTYMGLAFSPMTEQQCQLCVCI